MATDTELVQKLTETKELADAMVSKLRSRGHDDDHKLIRLAQDLDKWVQQYSQAIES